MVLPNNKNYVCPPFKEWYIQKDFFNWLSYNQKIREVSFSIPNEKGSRSIREMHYLKMSGMTSGAPDLGIFVPNNGYHGLFIEFKAKNGIVLPEQKIMLERLTKRNYFTAVCRSLDEGIAITEQYLQ